MSSSLKQLNQARAKMTVAISVVVFLLLTLNMLLMSSWADFGANPLYEGTHVTVALAYSIFVIFAGALISAFYIWWANSVLDKLVMQVKEEIAEGNVL